ncbi:MAG TPA: SPW repeat protein [Longimicrobium sp.]|nr:SPW repeat protein [Longimicrobium sp.]
MRLPTRVHGMLDYALGVLLIAAPWLLRFAAGGAETWVPVGVGAALLVWSLCTDYELGAAKRLQMAAHLWLDAIGGVFLAVSPWLLGFDGDVWLPHVVVGALMVLAAAVTDTIPAYERRRAAR